MYLPTLNHNSRIKEFSELNFEYFSESGPPIKCNSQYEITSDNTSKKHINTLCIN